MSGYDDILYKKRPTSSKHKPMSMRNRAAQFSPFAALSGFDSSTEETARLTDSKLELTDEQKSIINDRLVLITENIRTFPEATVTYFVPDEYKKGGRYLTEILRIKKIDSIECIVISDSGKIIPIDCIYDIEL